MTRRNFIKHGSLWVAGAAALIEAPPLLAAVGFDAYVNGGYQTATYSYTPSTPNSMVVLAIWNDSGLTGTPTYGGSPMTLATTHAATHPFGGNIFLYYILGAAASSAVISLAWAGQIVSGAFAVNGQNAVQPDSVAPYETGSQDGSGDCALAFTTIANNVYAIGAYGCSVTLSSNSANGTYIGSGNFDSYHLVRSTNPISPAGAFTLNARGANSSALYDAIGFSIKPSVSTAQVKHKVTQQ